MAPRVMARVNPAVLRWARSSRGFSIEEAAKKIGVSVPALTEAEQTTAVLTLPQLRSAAEVYRRSTAVFFLPAPPEEGPTVADFRRLPEAQGRPLSPNLRFEIRRIMHKRAIAVELEGDSSAGWSFVGSVTASDQPEQVATLARKLLGVELDEQRRWANEYKSFNGWRAAIEAIGVMVFQVSRIGVEEMRAFSLAEKPFPVIAVNRADHQHPRLFSLLHEFCHILLGRSGLCDLLESDWHNTEEAKRNEVFCNHVAGATLIPRAALEEHSTVKQHGAAEPWTLEELGALARSFQVSPEVVLRRLLILGRASQDQYRQQRERWLKAAAAEKENDDEDDFVPESAAKRAVRTQPDAYVRLVLDAMHGDRITASDAAEYLDLNLKHLGALEAQLQGTK